MTIIMVMGGRRAFALVYDPEVKAHLRAIARAYRGLIRTTIEEQLRFEPETERRNRKPLQPREEGSRLMIGREEIKL